MRLTLLLLTLFCLPLNAAEKTKKPLSEKQQKILNARIILKQKVAGKQQPQQGRPLALTCEELSLR